MVEPGAKVLDVGCGDGELLRLLVETRGVDGRGIELSREGVNECVAKGLAVIQGDADTDLADYPDDAFDYVILSQTLQATRQPRVVLEHMLRIGRHAHRVVSEFRPLAHPPAACCSAGTCRRPTTCPYDWWDSPNIHFCTIKDFRAAVRRGRREDGEGGRAQCLGPGAALQRAVVVLEPVRRAGGVFAQPARASAQWIAYRDFARRNHLAIDAAACTVG